MTYQQQGKPIVSELSNHIYGVGAYVPRFTQDRRQAKRNRKRWIRYILKSIWDPGVFWESQIPQQGLGRSPRDPKNPRFTRRPWGLIRIFTVPTWNQVLYWILGIPSNHTAGDLRAAGERGFFEISGWAAKALLWDLTFLGNPNLIRSYNHLALYRFCFFLRFRHNIQ